MDVKSGKLDFVSEVEPEIDKITKEALALSDASTLPDEVDREFWNNYIESIHKDIVINE
jgi:hypothetical protein